MQKHLVLFCASTASSISIMLTAIGSPSFREATLQFATLPSSRSRAPASSSFRLCPILRHPQLLLCKIIICEIDESHRDALKMMLVLISPNSDLGLIPTVADSFPTSQSTYYQVFSNVTVTPATVTFIPKKSSIINLQVLTDHVPSVFAGHL